METCRPFIVAHSPELGRHFVATRDILPLTEILTEKIAVIGPATKTTPVCLECFVQLKMAGELIWERPTPNILINNLKIIENGMICRCKGCNFPMCEKHSNSLDLNDFHKSDECKMLEMSNLGPTVELETESLPHACIFLARMWKLQTCNPDLFNSLYQLMEGDTTDIVSSFSYYLYKQRIYLYFVPEINWKVSSA